MEVVLEVNLDSQSTAVRDFDSQEDTYTIHTAHISTSLSTITLGH